MNTSNTANKPGSLPLERKNSPAPQRPVDNTVEQIEGIDRIGFFDEVLPGFDATSGSINFNLDTVVSPSTVSEIFGGSDQWVSFSAATVSDKVVKTASTIIKAAGDIAPDLKDAGGDLFNQMMGKTEVPQDYQKAFEGDDSSKLDPTVTAEQQKKQDTTTAAENSNRIIDNAIKQASQQEYEEMVNMALRLGVNVESLADNLHLNLRKADLLKNYYLALGDSLQVAERKAAAKAEVSVISSPAKHGAKGPGMTIDDNKSGERQGTTAQTATG